MTKNSSIYICQQCGNETGKWFGQCPSCGSWGSLVETVVSTKHSGRSVMSSGSTQRNSAKPISLGSISSGNLKRTVTKIPELDRVLGGGIVAGQVVLIAGEPGIGKSTILLQLAEGLGDVLYVSGEESVNQIKIRANRLGVHKKSIGLLEETDVDVILSTLDQINTPKLVIIDSIQTMFTSDLSGMSGSVGQVRESTSRLVRFAKSSGIPVFIVGHVTKSGSVAGPSVLMHIVDTVLWFEGSSDFQFRLLRARKNRFGPTDEVGIFAMEDKGLISLTDTSDIFLSEDHSIPGSVVGIVMEGTRPILVEIQSLIVPTKLVYPRRIAQGIDSKKLELLLAVLQRRAGINLSNMDVFVNVVGGIKVKDPGVDLAVCMSLASVHFDKPLSKSTVAIGEVGLMGEVRDVIAQSKRLTEARRLGYRNTIYSRTGKYLNQISSKYFK